MSLQIWTEKKEAEHRERCARLGLRYVARPTVPDEPEATTLSAQLREQRLETTLHSIADTAGLHARYEPEILKQAQSLGLRGSQIEKLKVLVAQFVKKCPFMLTPKPPEPVVVPKPIPEAQRHKLERDAAQAKVDASNRVGQSEAYQKSRIAAGLPVLPFIKTPDVIPPETVETKQPIKILSKKDAAYLKARQNSGIGTVSQATLDDWNRRQAGR